MTISQLIKHLQKSLEDNGDIPVVIRTEGNAFAPTPFWVDSLPYALSYEGDDEIGVIRKRERFISL